MAYSTMGRPKKAAARRNYKISFDVLSKLSVIARLEDRSDTAQLERFIKEGADKWEAQNPDKLEMYQALVDRWQSEMTSVES